jgi:hypothetical protein
MIHSTDPALRTIKHGLKKQGLNLDTVPTIATALFKKINDDVHSDFQVSQDKLLVVVKYFSPDELKLVKAIIALYPINDVEYREN